MWQNHNISYFLRKKSNNHFFRTSLSKSLRFLKCFVMSCINFAHSFPLDGSVCIVPFSLRGDDFVSQNYIPFSLRGDDFVSQNYYCYPLQWNRILRIWRKQTSLSISKRLPSLSHTSSKSFHPHLLDALRDMPFSTIEQKVSAGWICDNLPWLD